MTFPTTRLALLTTFILSLVGCANFLAERAPDPRLDQLQVAMEQCLSSQAEARAQIVAQGKQVQQQLESLDNNLADHHTQAANQVLAVAPRAARCPPQEKPSRKLVVGELEQVWLPNLELAVLARIDTGAETASIDARNIELFERNGRRWVRFDIRHPETGEDIRLERKLKRMVRIIQSNTTESERRPVIKLGITIGHVHQAAEFTLSNRSHLDSQLLIGRNILQDVMIVDVGRKNIAPYVLYGEALADGGKRK